MASNRRIILAKRPEGVPDDNNLKLQDAAMPEPGADEVLVRAIYLSLDPYMRARMSAAKSYAKSVEEGVVMEGATVGQVVTSNHADYSEGDFVLGQGGWQEYAVQNGKMLRKLDPAQAPISTAVGVLGMPGFTAYGFDICVNYKDDDFTGQLGKACPNGIDVYFENVGGKVFEAVVPLLNDFARMPVCGRIAHYNDTGVPEGPNRLPGFMGTVLVKRLLVKGFIQFDYANRQPDFVRDMGGWIRDGKMKYQKDIVEGLENTVSAFQGLLSGRNRGKLLVQVGDDPTRN